MGEVKFIRVNGRIVPIRKGHAKAKLSAVERAKVGGQIGAHTGAVIGSILISAKTGATFKATALNILKAGGRQAALGAAAGATAGAAIFATLGANEVIANKNFVKKGEYKSKLVYPISTGLALAGAGLAGSKVANSAKFAAKLNSLVKLYRRKKLGLAVVK